MSDGSGGLDRRLSWAIFALLFVSYAYFYQGGGYNENSHFDLTRALVDHKTLAIDAYHQNTADKAKVGEHYYSDKAPGLSVAAVPAYLALTPFRARTSEHDFVVIASYLATVLTVGLATALLGVLIYRVSRRLGASPRGSLLSALSYGVGTTAFPFATQFFSHQLAALCGFSAFVLLWSCRERYTDRRSFAAGCLAAGAIVSEFPTAIVALALGLYHADRPLRARRLLTFAAGVGVVLVPLALYLSAAFDSPLRTGYGVLADAGARSEMTGQGVLGVGYPRLGVFVELLIGRYRGLVPYSPILLLAFAGFALGLVRDPDLPADAAAANAPPLAGARRELWTALAVVLAYLVFVSSYAWWHGGSSFGSRHLLPMLPFLVVPLAAVVDLRPKLSAALFVLSFAVMTMVVSVQPKPSERYKDPLFSQIAPAFVRGQLASGNVCPELGWSGGSAHRPLLRRGFHDAFNLGMIVGGRHLVSLLPFLALWLSAGSQLWLATRSRRRVDLAK